MTDRPAQPDGSPMTEPKRIQRKRTEGWRMPQGAVYVGRPSKWGNPFLLRPVVASFPSLTVEQAARMVVVDFQSLVQAGHGSAPRGVRQSS